MDDNTASYELPERIWKEVYHTDLENLEEDCREGIFTIAKIVNRLPRFSMKMDWWAIGGMAMAFFVVAYLFSSHSRSCGFWSGLFLNLGMGIVSGLILFYFSERRTRVKSGYGVVAQTMRKRLALLRMVMDKRLENPHFVLFVQRDRARACQWIFVHHQFILTLKSHFRFWSNLLDSKVELSFAKLVARIDKRLRDINLNADGDYDALTKEELRLLCGDIWRLEYQALLWYEANIAKLQSKVWDLSFGACSNGIAKPYCENRHAMGNP